MDILQVQDRLKNFSQDQLVGEMQAPTGNAPQFLVLSEIMRRKRMQDDFAAQQGKAGAETTVAQEAIASAGVPQGGIADMARAMAPSTDMTQNTGVQAMASGGTVKKMAEGDVVVRGGIQYTEQADGSYVSEAPPFRITGTPRGGGIPSVLSTAIPPEAPVEEVPPTEAPVVGARTTVANPRGGGITSVVPLAVAPAEDPMIRLARESAEKAAAERDAAGITQSLETAEEGAAAAKAAREATQGADEAPAAPQGGSGSGVAGAASGMTSYEQELMDALARREKAAAQDKWLSLAQVGLNLMSSDQPTFGGALGEAGLAGVEAAQGARDQYEQDRLSLVGALEESRMARAKAAADAAKGAGGSSDGLGGFSISAGQGRLLTQINTDIERLDTMLNDSMLMGAELTPDQEMAMADAAAQRDQLVRYRQGLLYGAPLGAEEDDTNIEAADE